MDEITVKFPDATYRPEIFRADISNPMDIRTIVLKSKCVLNVAGPFMTTNAHLLVEACIDFDCDYVDVNGEVPFTHKLIGLHDYAKMRDVIICPNAAGAGGLPDLATFYAAEELRKVSDADGGEFHLHAQQRGRALRRYARYARCDDRRDGKGGEDHGRSLRAGWRGRRWQSERTRTRC